jgi:hypothetical protein
MGMSLVDETFEVYVQMRRGGKNAKATLEALRARIETMQPGDRADMVRRVKNWEQQHQAGGNVRPPARAVEFDPVEAEPPPPPPKPAGARIVYCPRCGKPNASTEVFCQHCGNFLSTESSSNETTKLDDPEAMARGNDFFGIDSTLVLIIAANNFTYKIQPQRFRHETVIGRSEGSTMKPDLDLSGHNASEMGVSRLHAALQYNAKNNLLSVSDMKSANGTFINGQKLFPGEVRVLRDGDELRLGRLVLHIYFQHPSSE